MLNKLFDKMAIISYNVSNWQRAKEFYEKTLELPVAAFINDEVGWMEFGEKDSTHLAISLWRGSEPIPLRGGGTAIFEVKDAYAAVAELSRRGVRCEDVVAVPDMVTFASFFDPDGNELQVAGPPPKK